jgi:methionine sulfoxide reductase heme-binding subunit
MSVLATTTPTAYWYLTRGTGAVALVLLTLGLVLGVMGPIGTGGGRWPRFVVAGLHRNVTLLALAFVVVHVVTTIADGFAPIGLRDAVVPFLSAYRPIWLGLGAVAFDLLLALILTSLLRRRMGLRIWAAVHWLAYGAWPVAMLHALGTGTDARLAWMTALSAACATAVAAAVAWRLSRSTAAGGRKAVAVGATLVAAVAGVAWYRSGPLQHGWARRAGTPATLLGAASVRPRAVETTLASVDALPATPFTAPLVGRFAEAGPDGNGLESVAISAVTRGRVASRLRIDLWGMPLDGGGVAMRASQVRFGPARSPSAYTGEIVGLDGNRLAISLHDATGRMLSLRLRLHIDRTAGQVTGSLQSLSDLGTGAEG